MLIPPVLFFASLLVGVSADFVIEGGKLGVETTTGTTPHSNSFSTDSAVSANAAPLPVTGQDKLKLGFTLSARPTGGSNAADPEPITPHQVAVLLTGKDTGRSWTAPIKIRKGGKARWEMDLARAPAGLFNLSPTGDVSVELLVADFGDDHKPVKVALGQLKLDAASILPFPFWDTKSGNAPAHLELERYSVQPNLDWTHRVGITPVNPIISLVFTGFVLAPWLILVSAWGHLARSGKSSGFALTTSPSPSTLLFLLCLAVQEALIVIYWFGLRLYQYLPIALLMVVPLTLTGRSALTDLRRRRMGRPIGAPSAGVGKRGKSE